MRRTDMGIARRWAEEMQAQILDRGDIAIDATMGNGHDTLRLCQAVGSSGRVYAFDVQPEALDATRRRLSDHGALQQARLILDGHQNMARHVHEQAALIVFNLGWLPGVEHAVTTRAETTLAAVQAALSLLSPGGLMTICVYPGHEEGVRELEALSLWAARLDPLLYDVILRRFLNQPNDPPVLIAVSRALSPRKARHGGH